MVGLRNRSVPQDGDHGDDGEGYEDNTPQAPPPDESGSSAILGLIYVLRLLIFLVQTGFTALASAAALSRDVIFDNSTAASPHAPHALQAPHEPQVVPPPYYLAPPHHLGERWYAVYVGRTIGVFNEWSDVADATVGVSGNSQRRFGTRAEAIASFHSAVQRRVVRLVPDNEPTEASGSSSSADCGNPKDTKPFTKKEEPDDD
ncbi:hypothetical protein BD410DRAFT_845972 [Rickenella mellea]|uniref:Ribonuclease H1 N-terminal domain-containing protein n=1 Tax=Rickenella mellea TaxID=50990 RepID=A0A4Y7PI43_9AGAM|nr:hypothetical protein BD410DRAFT_845972 [Rickenella mellea]